MILAGQPQPQFKPDPDNDGLFGPQSVTWSIHADSAMIVGGLTALLVQTLHPAAMAAVAQHSDYRSDPLGRLRRTVSFLGTTTFGTGAEARAAIDRLVDIHSQIRGETEQGVPYRADDPHLLQWVHCSEVWAFLNAHRTYGAASLEEHQYDSYVREMGVIGEALGVIGPPSSQRELACTLESYLPELEETALSADAVRFLADLRLDARARLPYRILFSAAVALQPAWAAALHDAEVGTVERALVPHLARATVRTIGWALAAPAGGEEAR